MWIHIIGCENEFTCGLFSGLVLLTHPCSGFGICGPTYFKGSFQILIGPLVKEDPFHIWSMMSPGGGGIRHWWWIYIGGHFFSIKHILTVWVFLFTFNFLGEWVIRFTNTNLPGCGYLGHFIINKCSLKDMEGFWRGGWLLGLLSHQHEDKVAFPLPCMVSSQCWKPMAWYGLEGRRYTLTTPPFLKT